MPTLLDKSFLNDINESYMIESIMGGYGNQIDYLIEDITTNVGLFESAEQKQRREKYLSLTESKPVEDITTDKEMFDDGEMIDSILFGKKEE